MSVRIIDKSRGFIVKNADAMDRALGSMAMDIERLSKAQVPHDTGALQTSGRAKRVGFLKHKVEFIKRYALRWEFETPPRGFKKGRKSRYLRDPAKLIVSKGKEKIKSLISFIRI